MGLFLKEKEIPSPLPMIMELKSERVLLLVATSRLDLPISS